VKFANEFDVVLNLADGATGYLETDDENLKIFDVIATALKQGKKHLIDVCSAERAQLFFSKRVLSLRDARGGDCIGVLRL